jgi:ribonucleoside-triphosphate reductase
MEKKITRQLCEIYSRCVGYIRPVSQWNPGKTQEFKDRVTFDKILDEKRKKVLQDK